MLPLYVAEPSIAGAPDFAPRHWTLIRQCLAELRGRLATRGQPLVVRTGEMPDVLDVLQGRFGAIRLWTHEETGNRRTSERDKRVRRWCHGRGVPFMEHPHMGVVRPLNDRDGWADRWEAQMARPLIDPPDALRPVGIDPGPIPTRADLDLAPCTAALQQAGETAAHEVLQRCLYRSSGRTYRQDLSVRSRRRRVARGSPSTSRLAPSVCGRCSMRQVAGALRTRPRSSTGVRSSTASRTKTRASGAGRSARSTAGCTGTATSCRSSRTRPASSTRACIEHESFIPAFDALRENEFDEALYAAWKEGRTGFPMVDASMRCLRQTGWLNFRMRAMLCSFAAYDCWLDWRRFAPFYARLMADYEPGIHYPQVQMQSGTTGINTVRIYNPVKQGKDHDPDGTFIRRWVPELRGITHAASVHAPWTMPPIEQHAAGCVVGRDYPERIVDHNAAYHHAHDRIQALRDRPEIEAKKQEVLEQHGSRR